MKRCSASDGVQGLLKGKTVYVITTRDGLHKGKSSDTQVPFIKNILGFIDIEESHALRAWSEFNGFAS